MSRILNIFLITLITTCSLNAQGKRSKAPAVQASRSVTLNISASLVTNNSIQLITLRNMILAGMPGYGFRKCKEILPGEIYISPVTDFRAGLLMAKGVPNTRAILRYRTHEILEDMSGTGTISIRYKLSSSPVLFQRSSVMNDNGEIVLNFDRNGKFYIWVGGFVNLRYATSGKYTGQFTFEILYI
jgi:hypothetical protein